MTTRVRRPLLATAAAVALVGSVLAVGSASASPAAKNVGRHFQDPTIRNSISHGLPRVLADSATHLPVGVPSRGNYAFLLRLRAASTISAYRQHLAQGRSAASSAAESQLHAIKSDQASVIAALPAGSHVLYTTHSLLAGVAVLTNVRNYGALQRLDGVTAVYPIAPKTVSNSYAMPLQHAPQAWQAQSDLGASSTIAIIDTGVDYTHANFGGVGTPAAYNTAKTNDTAPVDSSSYDHAKFDTTVGHDGQPVAFHDFAGDSYNADPNPTPPEQPYQPVPHPDSNPLDCDGHGSHVAGIAAGYGENPDGSTFTGNYLTLPTDTSSYQADFRIGPGMAPEAKLLAFKVFGCSGSTDLVGAAIERAIDPNQDGNPADHVSVINMSLGSDYASPQDGDAVETNLASQDGIVVVAASGNGGDEYDVGGSPGNASRAISVANSVDAYNRIDTLHATVNGSPQTFGVQRSAAYDWASNPDLSGSVVKLTDSTNLDGCAPLDSTDAAFVNGKIAFLEWTDNDIMRRCGSAAASANVISHGAVGVILADDSETFAAGIVGSDTKPVVMVVKSAGDAIRSALNLSEPVVVTATSASDFTQPLITGDNDKLNSSSSRGVRGAGDLKPDVTAVGTSVFSTAMGTGSQGVSFTGTSMAAPMVAGLAALVRSEHSDWTPEEVKADIMNTAGQDLFTGSNHSGTKYAPNRVGAGRIVADAALANTTLAFVKDNPGAVSVSFGPVAVTTAMTFTKTVNVENKGAGSVTYNLAYVPSTSVPGVSYQVSPTTMTIAAGATGTFTVKFVVTNPASLTKTHDSTMASNVNLGGGLVLGTETLADASGRVVLTPTAGATIPLRVPVYSAPRPASVMSQPSELTLPGSGVQSANIKLSGTGLNRGFAASKIQSLVSGFELQATSGRAPTCASTTATSCVHFADERSADLKYVGTTSDFPLLKGAGDATAFQDSQADFAITTQRAWRTPVGPQEFDILIDTNGDNRADAIVYNTRLGASDIFLSEMLDVTNADPTKWFIRDDEFVDDRLGNSSTFPSGGGPVAVPGVDTALYDSDTMVLPVQLGAMLPCSTCGFGRLPLFSSTHSRVRYGVVTFGESGVVDSIGVNLTSLTGSAPKLTSQFLTTDLAHTGIETSNASTGAHDFDGGLLNNDTPGSTLTVRRDVTAYNTDHGRGLLLVHYQNAVGNKAQVVTLKTAPKVSLTLSATTVVVHNALTATVTVANTAGHVPTGKVTLHKPGTDLSASLVNGKVTFTWKPGTTGTFSVSATYDGDANYARGNSPTKTFKVVT